MSNPPLKLAVIVGSIRDGRFGPTVADWFARQAGQREDITVDVIDLADFPLPLVMPAFGQKPDPETAEIHRRLGERLAASDAFAVVTPEYNHTVTPALSNAINWYMDQWMAKPVGLISYGGMGGGLRAAEHLRQIFAEVHAVTVREMLSFHNAWSHFHKDGEPVSPEGSEGAAKSLLDQLAWWGNALRQARAEHPYKR
ncbi:NAD(P)H-dependent oxidoreductase (plasmid) [Streptomyces sp. NBC_01384]|uniref:NADPH-dependent FMN reductase n=1 Tax=Streptomyces sp. NBC_01384 TaxID=2903847 RepID=UPI002F909BB7